MNLPYINLLFFFFLSQISFLYSESDLNTSFHRYYEHLKSFEVEEKFYLNNTSLQSYHNLYGYWVKVSRKSKLSGLLNKYDLTVEEVKNANPNMNLAYIRNDWVFFPDLKIAMNDLSSRSIRKGDFVWPLDRVYITSRVGNRWGTQHSGLDIAVPSGSLVLASQTGKIKKTGFMGGYGLTIIIEHEQGYETLYAHLSNIMVKVGDTIKRGEAIAYSGNTGKSTGPHLHLELRCHGVVLDPENFLIKIEKNNKGEIQVNLSK